MERELGWFKKESASDDERRHALAHELGVPFVQLDRHSIAPDALLLIPEPLAREHNLAAYSLSDRTVEVALLDLADLSHVEFLRAHYRLLPRLTTRESLNGALITYQRHLRELYGRKLEQTDSPELLDSLLRHALHSQSSDIHLQQGAGGTLVRYRIRGSLKVAMTLPPAAGKNVITRLRALSNTPAGTLPREGRLRVDLGAGEDLVVRVSSVPILGGEKLVLHLVRERERQGYTLESLGFHGEALEAVHARLLKRRGLVVVSGGEKSGKRTLLYTLLDLLNTPELSVATIEDEVLQALPRVAQTDLSVSGVAAPAALRAALRADADVVLVHTASVHGLLPIAVAAAERGVLVVVATDDKEFTERADLVVRTALLRRLGSKQFSDRHKLSRAEADTLEVAASFAKVLTALKEEEKVPKDTAWKDIAFAKPVPSSESADGYEGYIGVQEVVAGGKTIGLNLVEDALFKAAQGLTDSKEVTRLLP